MRSFVQIVIGIAILGAAFVFGQRVHQQQVNDETRANNVPGTSAADADTSWQNRTGQSLIDLSQSTPAAQSGVQPLVPFPNLPSDNSAIPQTSVERSSTMPNHLSGIPVQREIFAPLYSGERNLTAPPLKTADRIPPALKVPFIEPDFSEVNSGHTPALTPIAPALLPANQPKANQPGSNDGAGNRPTAPEFTIYPDADRASASDFAGQVAQQDARPGIAPVADPLIHPAAPAMQSESFDSRYARQNETSRQSVARPEMPHPDSIVNRNSAIEPDSLPGSDTSWADAFNEPLPQSGPTANSEPTTQNALVVPEGRGLQTVLDSNVAPQQNFRPPAQDGATRPLVANSQMVPFRLSDRAKSELVAVATRQNEFQLTTNRFVRHRTEQGDTLQQISTEHFGSADFYLDIYLANQDQLRNPAEVPSGIELRIPVYE